MSRSPPKPPSPKEEEKKMQTVDKKQPEELKQQLKHDSSPSAPSEDPVKRYAKKSIFSEGMDDEDYVVEYDRDILFGHIMKKIDKLVQNERDDVKNAVDLIMTIKFDRKKLVTLDGIEYHCKLFSFIR